MRASRLLDHPVLLMLRDFPLFLIGARTDALVERMRAERGAPAAFEQLYRDSCDPWASARSRFRYQTHKYEQIVALIPKRTYRNALDIGCGLGLLAQRLTACSQTVLGIDVAASAVAHARTRAAGKGRISFAQGDLLNLPGSLDGRFDLIVVADVLYYLSPLEDELLVAVAARIADLLTDDGVCLVANHFFSSYDAESKLSRRIHEALSSAGTVTVLSEHRRAFFIATLLSRRNARPDGPGCDRRLAVGA